MADANMDMMRTVEIELPQSMYEHAGLFCGEDETVPEFARDALALHLDWLMRDQFGAITLDADVEVPAALAEHVRLQATYRDADFTMTLIDYVGFNYNYTIDEP